jgi:hypothetical protein
MVIASHWYERLGCTIMVMSSLGRAVDAPSNAMSVQQGQTYSTINQIGFHD